VVSADGQGKKQVGGGHELGQGQPVGALDDDDENAKEQDQRAQSTRQEGDEIEERHQLQEDQREGSPDLHDAAARWRLPRSTVGAEPQNGIDQGRERRRQEGGIGTGAATLIHGA